MEETRKLFDEFTGNFQKKISEETEETEKAPMFDKISMQIETYKLCIHY